jgi:outer membrane protein TolC
LFSNQSTLTSLQIEQMTGAIQLVEALGGGWDTTQLPTPAQVTAAPSKADSKIQQ